MAAASWQGNQIAANMYGWSIHFSTTSNGYAIGDQGKIYKTTNGGDNWTVTTHSSNVYMTGITFLNENEGYICGYSGVILKTTNAGTTWDSLATGTSTTLQKITINANGELLACGYSGTILRSTNHGASWSAATGLTAYTLNDIKFVNNNTAYAVTSNGQLFVSNNAGATWQMENSITGNEIRSLSIVTSSKLLMFGQEGNIVKYTPNLTSTGTGNNEVPSSYKLEQNYPNPFNPSTTVKFSIPNEGSVKLAIFDITGREVKTLVNENMQSGSYEISFNGADISSGVYFYRLDVTGKAGLSYSDTKKMILVK
jgi:hypothetical protein